ncbi:hypothetical protein CBS101457_003063 [Exobasidium rhododendri]|nr:hypothetical protein CBS101457_003063 [Exobasidium rhododendri]
MSDNHTLTSMTDTSSSPVPSVFNQDGTGKRLDVETSPVETSVDLEEKKEEKDIYLVGFESGDKENPREWSNLYKAWVTLELGFLAFAASLGSSIISPANAVIAAQFHVSSEIMILSVSLYLLGFAFGPMLWAPVSEIWGRRWSILPPMCILALFSIGTAVSRNAATVLVTRFFAGLFASAPVSNVSAALGDLYIPYQRGTAIAFYALCVVGGPLMGPIIGSALTVKVSWRWTMYLLAIWTFATVALTFFLLPEVYAPVLLKRKAQKLRKETGNSKYHHPHEELKLDFRSIVTKHFSRPLRMLFFEPIVTVVALYASFVYAILYMSLEWVPIVFEDVRGWHPIVASLPFIALFIGVLAAMGLNLGSQPYYHRAVEANGGKAVPEARLPPIMIGSFFFCGGLFWFGWTSPAHYHWILPCFGLLFIGLGFSSIFQQCINFLVDSYPTYAASATSANTILRSLLAAGLPLAVQPMYRALGVPVSLSILGAFAGVAIPLPFIFKRYGAAIRSRSSFATP